MSDVTSWKSVLKTMTPPLDDEQIEWLNNQEPVFIDQFICYYSMSESYDRAIHRAIEETLSILIPETIVRIGGYMQDDEKTVNEKLEFVSLVLDPQIIYPVPY